MESGDGVPAEDRESIAVADAVPAAQMRKRQRDCDPLMMLKHHTDLPSRGKNYLNLLRDGLALQFHFIRMRLDGAARNARSSASNL